MATALYVINPDDPTNPTENLTMGAAAAELRALKQRVLLARQETADLEARALSHVGAEPYELDAQFNANENKITELPQATEASDAVPLSQVLALIGAAGSGIVASVRQKWIATEGQTVFSLSLFSYVPTANNIAVYVDGIRQDSGTAYVETDSTSFTFTEGLQAGSVVHAFSNESVNANAVDLLRTDLASTASGKGPALLGFKQSGAGAVDRLVQDELRERVSASQFSTLSQAAVACRTALSDGTGRTVARTLEIPAGNYTIDALLQLAPANGLTGFTIKGAGAAATFINFSGATASIACQSSRAITFEDLTFVSSGVDSDQTAFTIAAGGNPLRSWRFNRCDFYAFWKCFSVSGSTMCSEFFFDECNFSNCYILMDNNNEQAVNWNFKDCSWENESLATTKDKNLAAVFNLQKGTFSNWVGGSLIFHGRLAYFNLTTSNAFARTSHKLHFTGVRIELEDLSGSHAPIVDRVSSGYVNGGNAPTVSLTDFTILNRGTLPATLDLFAVWANCALTLTNGECEGGNIVGILDGVTAASNGSVFVQDVRGINYREDTTSRVNSHDQHNVTLIPDVSSNGTQPITDYRLGSLSVPASVMPKCLYVRGPTGSLPQSATSVNLPALPDHTTLLKLFCYRFTVAGQSLTADLRDQADTTSYGSVTLAAGVTNAEAYIGREMGQQIPSGTPLMLKFTGSAPEVVKGVVGLEYL